MHNNMNIGVIASDLRQIHMARQLAEKGYNVFLIYSNIFDTDKNAKNELCHIIYNEEMNNLNVLCDIDDIIETCDVIAGPVPMDKISEFMVLPKFISLLIEKSSEKNMIFYAGMIDKDTHERLSNSGILCIDYMKSEKLTVYNTIATAEGIIAEAILHKNTNLHGSKTLVLGYGKCGKTLAHKLHALSADVTVCARSEDALEVGYSAGLKTLMFDKLNTHIHEYEYIFNTIPTLVLNESMIRNMRADASIFDIASAPGGVDKNACLKYGIFIIHSLGIPGRYAAKSSGKSLANHMIKILEK